MMITTSNKLEIFENFVSIPKTIKKDEISSGSISVSNMTSFISGAMERDSNSLTESIEVRAVDYFHYLHMHEHTLKSWIKLKAAEILFELFVKNVNAS